MFIPVPASLLRLLMCGMLLVAPGAMGQTTTGAKPTTKKPAKPASARAKRARPKAEEDE